MSSIIYQCTLPLPPSVNALYGGGSKQRRFKSKAYVAWIKSCGTLCMPQCGCIDWPIKIKYDFYWPDNKVRDAHNFLKAIDDYLVNNPVISDDCWKVLNKSEVTNQLDKEKPRVVITLLTIDND
jgi:Holliday junction resolvase RusA-like endonuclease